MKLWDVAGGREIRSFPGHASAVFGVAFHGDGRRAASACTDDLVRLWDTETGALLKTFRGHTGPVFDVAFHPDGRRLASGGNDATVRLWDTGADGPPLNVLRGHTGAIRSLASPNGAAWRPRGKTGPSASGTSRAEMNLTFCADLTASPGSVCTGSETLASTDFLGTVKLWKADTPPRVLSLMGRNGWAFCGACSDGRLAASGVGPHLSLGRRHRALGRYPLRPWQASRRLVFDREGRRLVSAGEDGLILVWDVAPTPERAPSPGTPAASRPSPSIPTAVGWPGGADQAVRLWDLDSGREERAMSGPIKSPSA